MQINEGMFLLNGKCGYVLKPEFTRKDKFDPYNDQSTVDEVEPTHLTITVSQNQKQGCVEGCGWGRGSGGKEG